MSFVTSVRLSVRPSSCISCAVTGKISVKFVIGDFHENRSRKKKNVVKERPKCRALYEYMMLTEYTFKFPSR